MPEYHAILKQIDAGQAMLFLGAGSSQNCRRPNGTRGVSGNQLALEILMELNGGKPLGFDAPGLMQASEMYTAVHPAARNGLDQLVRERLADLSPTIGHAIAASFPWRAVVTTNYNRVAEDAWGEAHGAGYGAKELVSIRSNQDLEQFREGPKHIALYKPHGCITIEGQKENRMVLTSLDYFESERIRDKVYEAIRTGAKGCSTVFAGYSLADYTFKNIYYRLLDQNGQWAHRCYSVDPVGNPTRERWLGQSLNSHFKTELVNETFDTFMLRLALARGHIHPKLRDKIEASWNDTVADNHGRMAGITKAAFKALPAR